MNVFLWLTLFAMVSLLLYVYARHSLRISATFDVLQIPVEAFVPEMLYQRSVIMFNEPIVNMRRTVRHFLMYHHAFERVVRVPDEGGAFVNRSKYLAVSFRHPASITVTHPFYPNERLELKVFQDSVVILPRLYTIEIQAGTQTVCVQYDDVFSALVARVRLG
jgi:hypothetical protein